MNITGSFTGVAEGVFYAANLKNTVVIGPNDTVCASRQACNDDLLYAIGLLNLTTIHSAV